MPNLAGEKFERPDDDARGEGDDNRRLVRVSPINKIENFQRGVESGINYKEERKRRPRF